MTWYGRLSDLRTALFKPQPLDVRGERAAARFLRRRGYKIVARRHRWRRGDLDLVAVDGRTVVFVEVKTRRTHRAGHPAEAVGPEKQRRIANAAVAFLKAHGLLEHSARFDVVALTWPSESRRPTIEHYIDAFQPAGRGQMYQ